MLNEEYNELMAMLIKQRRSLNEDEKIDFLETLSSFQLYLILAEVQNVR